MVASSGGGLSVAQTPRNPPEGQAETTQRYCRPCLPRLVWTEQHAQTRSDPRSPHRQPVPVAQPRCTSDRPPKGRRGNSPSTARAYTASRSSRHGPGAPQAVHRPSCSAITCRLTVDRNWSRCCLAVLACTVTIAPPSLNGHGTPSGWMTPRQIRPVESVLGTGRRCGPGGAGHVQNRKRPLGGLAPAGQGEAASSRRPSGPQTG